METIYITVKMKDGSFVELGDHPKEEFSYGGGPGNDSVGAIVVEEFVKRGISTKNITSTFVPRDIKPGKTG